MSIFTEILPESVILKILQDISVGNIQGLGDVGKLSEGIGVGLLSVGLLLGTVIIISG